MKKVRTAAILTATVMLVAPLVASGAGTVPRSSLPGAKALGTVERMEIPAPDIDALLAEDAT